VLGGERHAHDGALGHRLADLVRVELLARPGLLKPLAAAGQQCLFGDRHERAARHLGRPRETRNDTPERRRAQACGYGRPQAHRRALRPLAGQDGADLDWSHGARGSQGRRHRPAAGERRRADRGSSDRSDLTGLAGQPARCVADVTAGGANVT
jgi:hypothetical protein